MDDRPRNTDQAMEKESRFDLNNAIHRWRQELASSPAFRRENLDELEAHLRDSVVRLQSEEVTPAEAFFIASRRLGSRADLEHEFGKANIREVWIDRCLWMLMGLLFYLFFQLLSSGPLKVWMHLALSRGVSEKVVATLYYLVWTGGPVVGIAIGWWLCTRSRKLESGWAKAGTRWPWILGPAIVAILYASSAASERLADFILALTGTSVSLPRDGMEIYRIVGLLMPLNPVLWVGLLPILAGDAKRLRQKAPTQAGSTGFEGLTDGQRGHVNRLQSQHLSFEESCLLVARRERIQPRVESRPARNLAALTDRALWMASGIAINLLLQGFLFQTSWIYIARIARAANLVPLNGYVFGALCLLVSLAEIVVIVGALWNFVMHRRRAAQWIASICLRHPWRAGLGAALICFVVQLALLALFRLFIPFSQDGSDPFRFIDFRLWFKWNPVLTQIILPVAALLWLIRARTKTTVSMSPNTSS